ncbi:tetratricopeptide repeat protein [uncultured Mailhella sp.]|uniref:tetratricopeptide repeat protein n=1 Tax=uncultured Mailhella sp. TaxID=1981031 RepID=UPI0026006C38|nr:tetratricopeptide repeat protein [uncultured Mailhella sp.]
MLTDSQITRLLDIANAGCHKGLVLQARAIYDGVLAVRPGHVPALIGQALSHIVIGEYDEAEKLLCDGVLSEHPDDADAKAMLGLCLCLADKKEEARAVLSPLVENGGQNAELARSLLENMDAA